MCRTMVIFENFLQKIFKRKIRKNIYFLGKNHQMSKIGHKEKRWMGRAYGKKTYNN